jgi:hypothetical protein
MKRRKFLKAASAIATSAGDCLFCDSGTELPHCRLAVASARLDYSSSTTVSAARSGAPMASPRGKSAVHTTGKKFTILRGKLVLKPSIASRSRHRRDSGHLQTPSQRGGNLPQLFF